MGAKKSISNSFTVNTVEDGTSPYFADLDNGIDSVACDYQGVTTSEQFVETNVCMFFGNQKQVIPISGGIVCKIGNTTLGSSYQGSGVGYNYKVEVTNLGTTSAHIKLFVRDNTEIDSTTVTITVSVVGETGNESANLNFVINGVRAGKAGNDAVLYNLQPAQNEIVVSAKTDGTYTPSSFSLTCAYKKVVGGSVTTNNINGTIDSEYRVFFSRRRRNNKQWESDYYWYNSTTHATKIRRVNGVGGLDVITYDMVAFIFYKDNSSETISAASVSQANLVDKETVGVVSNGVAAPKYNDEFYAWNNVESTADAETSPFTEPYAGWSSSIPAQGSYAYLWKKIVPYSWNDTTLQYTAGTPQYFRMTGTEGTSINMAGKIKYAMSSSGNFPQPQASESGNLAIKAGSNTIYKCSPQAPGVYAWTPDTTASDGNAYTVVSGSFTGSYQSTELAGHLVLWSQEAGDWVDLGKFKGENGTTYYTHIVWASNVTFSGGVVQTITGYLPTKPEGDTEHPWMGVYVDTNSADPTSGDDPLLNLYTWSNTKGDTGDDGDPAAVALATPDKISVPCNVDGGVSSAVSIPMSFSMRIGNTAATNVRVSPPSSMPTGVSYSGSTQNTGTITISTSATATGIAGGVTFTVIGSDGTKDYTATVTVALIGAIQGGQGERGRTGRFYYYGGDWNANNNTKKFVIDDAQTVYFSKAGSSSNQYYLFDYIADSYQDSGYTMYQMWNSLTVKTGEPAAPSWNNEPWEVMTQDFKYLILQAVFTDFAKLGSFIISGDWMFSQFGVLYDANGTAYLINSKNLVVFIDGEQYSYANAYLKFDANYPNSSKPNEINFCPFLADDGLTGVTYRQRGNIGGFVINSTQIKSTNENIILNSDGSASLKDCTVDGEIKSGAYDDNGTTKYANLLNRDGSGHLAKGGILWDGNGNTDFNGVLHAKSFYQEYQDLGGGEHTLDISNGSYILAEPVPDELHYDECEVIIPAASQAPSVTLTIVCPVAERGRSWKFPIIRSAANAGGFYTKKEHSGSYRLRNFTLVPNLVVKLQSIANSWFLDTEEDYLTDVTPM